MSRRFALLSTVPALAGLALTASTASAGQVTVVPTSAEARTFATTQGGWTSSVSGDCPFGLTCASATPSYVSSGGASGAADGHLRDAFATAITIGSTTTATWTSPAFEVPPSVDVAQLTLKVRTQTGGLASAGSTLSLVPRLVDLDDPSHSFALPSRALTQSTGTAYVAATFDVPTSALVAGHDYRLALDVPLKQGISVIANGNVDLDDVALTLTDLDLAQNLQASVPSTGAPRVTGSVDTTGFDTDVTVEYGPTTDYGSTTTPVALSGGGTGTKTFTVPLTGLEPGATYHYRVRATTADGSVTTTDATFVAPSPPSKAAPTVSGAGNARGRTVTFDRAADVSSAVVELLDADGTVVQSWPDTGDDGTVAITLPDADGTYRVRVRRTSDRELQSVSDAVPVTLDRSAPSVSDVDAKVTPTVSDDRARTVTFTRPADAATVTAQVVDADGQPVGAATTATGGSASVQLGSADGSYRVRLTFTDAAGNASTVTTGAVTLDRTAPVVSGVDATVTPVISNDRTRTVAFTRPADAATVTAQVLDAGGQPVGSAQTVAGARADVQLGSADGSYRVRLTFSDAAGNAATVTSGAVTLDTAAPAAGPAPTVTGAASSRTRTVGFVRDPSATTATVELLDASGKVVDTVAVDSGADSASVTLPNADGAYAVRVVQRDAAGNAATTDPTALTLDTTGPDVSDVDAKITPAVSKERSRTVTFTRPSDATTVTAQVLDGDGQPVGAPTTIAGSSAGVQLGTTDGTYRVRLTFTDALGNATPVTSSAITLDTTPPAAGPAPTATGAGSSRTRTVSFTRDPSTTTATVELLDADGTVIGTVRVPADASSGTVTLPDADGDYAVRVVQEDAAGNSATTGATAVRLDTKAPSAGPAPTVSGTADALVVSFERAPDAATAVVEIRDADGRLVKTVAVPAGASTATVSLPGDPGRYDVRVVQTDAAGNSSSTAGTATDRAAAPGGGNGGNGGNGNGNGNGGNGNGGTGGSGNGGNGTPPPGSGSGQGTGTNGPGAPLTTGPGGSGGSGGATATCPRPTVVVLGVKRAGKRVRVTGWSSGPRGAKLVVRNGAGRPAGTARIGAKGRFSAVVAGPGRKVRRNALRYRVVLNGRSAVARPSRGATLKTVRRRGTIATLQGRVDVRRLGRTRTLVAVGGSGACPNPTGRLKTVGKAKIARNGRFRLRVRIPASGTIVVRVKAKGARGTGLSPYVVR